MLMRIRHSYDLTESLIIIIRLVGICKLLMKENKSFSLTFTLRYNMQLIYAYYTIHAIFVQLINKEKKKINIFYVNRNKRIDKKS